MLVLAIQQWFTYIYSVQTLAAVWMFVLLLHCLFNAKSIFLQKHKWQYLTHCWEDKGVHAFTKGICPKVNEIARLEFELAYYDCVVRRFDHYSMRIFPGV